MSVAHAPVRRSDGQGWTLASLLVAAIVLAPIIALFAIAAQGSGDLWPHLLAYVLPQAVHDTALLLLGVGVVTVVVGVGTAWLVTTCRFPGRGFFDWALLPPLAVPTYIVAFAYLDILHPLGPIQTALRLTGRSRPCPRASSRLSGTSRSQLDRDYRASACRRSR